VRPTHAATGYGYIESGDEVRHDGCRRVVRFAEKPKASDAETFIRLGFTWNTGNFLFKPSAFLAEAKRFAPEVFTAVDRSLTRAVRDSSRINLDAASFAEAKRTSVDFAIMEKTPKAAVLDVSYVWSDVGSWDAVQTLADKNKQGNAISSSVIISGSRNNFVYSNGPLVALVGVDDLVVIATDEAILVARREKSEDVKVLAEKARALAQHYGARAPAPDVTLDSSKAIFKIDVGNGTRLGPGKVRLLELIDEAGSIAAAARKMGMSYRRAWLLIGELNGMFAEVAVERSAGGKQGGGARVTPHGKKIVKIFRGLEAQIEKATQAKLAGLLGPKR
jgi:molybdate transport repressor ModE-like protein